MEWLLDSGVFITRDHCGLWGPTLIIVNQLANFLIFFSYFSIPVSLMILYWKMSKIMKRHWVLLLFVIFIFSCGLTHLMDVMAFSWPAYRFFTVVDVITALASVPTAVLLPVVINELAEDNGCKRE